MNLSQLQFIRAVSETGSFSRAAEKCFVTQPSLSNAIAHFESEIGGQLFVRTTRKVDVTPFGAQLLPLIAAVLDAKAELEKSAKSYLEPSHKLLRVGLSPLIDLRLLTTALEPFARSNPEIEIVFKECYLDDLTQRMEQHKTDVAFAPDGFLGKVQGKCTVYEDQLFYLPRKSAKTTESVLLKEIASEVFAVAPDGCGLSISIRRMFERNSLKFREYAGQALSHSVLQDWAELGVSATILPSSKISKSTHVALPIMLSPNRPAKIKVVMVWNSKAAQPTHAASFIEYVRKSVPAIVKGLSNII